MINKQTAEKNVCTCERCGHVFSSLRIPKVCPSCKNPNWNIPRENAKSNAVDNSDEGITKKEGSETPIPSGASSPFNSQNKVDSGDFLDYQDETDEPVKNIPVNALNSVNPDDYDYQCAKCNELFNKKGNEAGNGQVRCPDCQEIYDE